MEGISNLNNLGKLEINMKGYKRFFSNLIIYLVGVILIQILQMRQ